MNFLFVNALLFLLFVWPDQNQANCQDIADPTTYLSNLKVDLAKEWPKNHTINIVFHGHSVPAGYFKTPVVNTLSAYPNLFLKRLKEHYPFAVVNTIVTAIGGENSEQGAARFATDVLLHKPDVVLIDYALNDRRIGLEKARLSWQAMIEQAQTANTYVILLTPSPDLSVDLNNPKNELKQHTDQIRQLASQYHTGLIDSYQLFDTRRQQGDSLNSYMSQVNHPNEAGHTLSSGTQLIKINLIRLPELTPDSFQRTPQTG